MWSGENSLYYKRRCLYMYLVQNVALEIHFRVWSYTVHINLLWNLYIHSCKCTDP